MGIVFAAEAPSGETVAIKLIGSEQLCFDRSRARFEREIQSAKLLDHPGVARVIDSAEDAGIPFIVQEWVARILLNSLLQSLRRCAPEEMHSANLRRALEAIMPPAAHADSSHEPNCAGTWNIAAMRLARQVEEALDHAHSRRVLHRDVKSSDVVLTPSCRVVLTDLGLAIIADADRLTRTGTQAAGMPSIPLAV